MSLHVCAIMYVLKYLNSKDAPSYNEVPLIKTLRSCCTVLQKEGESARLTSKEELQGADKWIEWEEVLQAMSNQEKKFDAAVGLKKAKEMASLLLISLHCRIPPSRGLEIRTLRVVCETASPEPSTNWKTDYKGQNIVYLLADGSVQLHFQIHKTVKSFGADHLNLKVRHKSIKNNASF